MQAVLQESEYVRSQVAVLPTGHDSTYKKWLPAGNRFPLEPIESNRGRERSKWSCNCNVHSFNANRSTNDIFRNHGRTSGTAFPIHQGLCKRRVQQGTLHSISSPTMAHKVCELPCPLGAILTRLFRLLDTSCSFLNLRCKLN